MTGIQYLTNEKGKKVAVQIDLLKHGELWEDFYDLLVARRRAHDPRESIEFVRNHLRKMKKLDG
jgi:hypothetical protein